MHWGHLHYICVIIAIAFFPISGIVSWDPIEDSQYNGGVIFVPVEEDNFYMAQDDPVTYVTSDISHDYNLIPVPREDLQQEPELEAEPIPIPIILGDNYPAEYFDYVNYDYDPPEPPQYGETGPIFDPNTEIRHAVPAARPKKSSIDRYEGQGLGQGRKDTVDDDWGLSKEDYKEDDDENFGWDDSSISHADAFGYSKRFYKLKSYKVRKGSIFDRSKKKFAYNPGYWDYHASKNYDVHKYAHHPLDKYQYIYKNEKFQKFKHPLDKYDALGWKEFDFTKGRYQELKKFLAEYNRYYYGW